MGNERRPLTRGQKVGGGLGALVLGGATILGAMHHWESHELTVYADKLARGLPTYCSGRTNPPLPVGMKLTQDQCDEIDAKTAAEYGRGILACIPADKLDQASFDALTLFAINVGTAGACGSRAAQLIRAGDRQAGCRALATGADGKPVWSSVWTGRYLPSGAKEMRFVQGLANRRLFERNLCLGAAVTTVAN